MMIRIIAEAFVYMIENRFILYFKVNDLVSNQLIVSCNNHLNWSLQNISQFKVQMLHSKSITRIEHKACIRRKPRNISYNHILSS